MDNITQSSPPPRSHPSAIIPHPTVLKVARRQVTYDVPRPYSADVDGDSEQEGDLLQNFRVLRRHKNIIALSALVGLALGFAVGIPMKPVYSARSSLEVLSLNADFMNMRQSNPVTTGGDSSSDTSEEQTQARLLESTALLQRVSAKIDPGHEHINKEVGPAVSGWRNWLHLPEPVSVDARQQLLANTANSLKVRPVGRTRVLEVTVNSKDPQLAADFVNTLVQEFIQMNLEARYASTHQTSEWLHREIEDARLKLETSEAALQKYARESGLIFTNDDTNVATERLQQLQQQLSAATGDRIAKESRFRLSVSGSPNSLADVLGDENLQANTAKIHELENQVASLSAVFNPGYNKLQEAQAQLTVAQAAFENDRAKVVERIKNDYQQAVNNEKMLANTYNEQTREVTGQSEKAIQYNILKREVESNRLLYDTMLQQTKQASIASAMRASNVRIVDSAQVPTRAIFPDFRINSAVGFFLGAVLSVVAIIIRERSDRTFQQPGEMKQWTDLSELGVIPSATARSQRVGYGPATSIPSRATLGSSNPNSIELVTWQQKSSFVSEAFRSSMTSIFFVGNNGTRPHTIVFTSATAAEGKTTVVSNLAIATAEIHLKVLVIDADMRRPRMHEVFTLSNDRGLSTLLSGEPLDYSLPELIQETSIPNLHVLPAGPPAQSAAHLLYSPKFEESLNRLHGNYDMILIDTPPVLQVTDARIAARFADGVVLVARANSTTRDMLLAVRDRFAEDRIAVLGAILNDWDPSKSPTDYYGKYHGAYNRNYSYAAEKA